MELFVIARCAIYLLLTAASFQVLEPGNGPSALNSLRAYAVCLTFSWLFYLFPQPLCQTISWIATAGTCGTLVSFASRRSGRGSAWTLCILAFIFSSAGYLYFLYIDSIDGLHHTTMVFFGLAHLSIIYYFLRYKKNKTSSDYWVVALAATTIVLFNVRSLLIVLHPDLTRVFEDLLAVAQPIGDGILLFALLGYTQEAQNELRQQKQMLKDLAYYDSLTKLPNRHLLNDRFRQVISRSKRLNYFCAILFLDLNKFKQLNDLYGHNAGDRLLMQFSDRLRHIIRESDTAARFGGDEFVILLEGLGDDKSKAEDYAMNLVDKIRMALVDEFSLGEIQHRCSASIGTAVFIGDEFDPDQLLKHADMAMYRDKQTSTEPFTSYQLNFQSISKAAI